MNDFTFPCPACNQDISCNAALIGARINCPHCLKLVVVPSVPAAAPGTTSSPPATAQKTSALAIASLVCSLASIITCIGWIPGIICGHIARAKIRRNSALKGSGLALAGLIAGYSFFVFQAGYVGIKIWRISSAMKQGFTEVRNEMKTNPVVIVETTSNAEETASPEPAPEPTAVDNNTTIPAVTTAAPANDGNWTTDPDKMVIPDHTVDGIFHGNNFLFRRAFFRGAGLKIVSANRASLEIHNLGNTIDGKSFNVQIKDPANAIPHLVMTWPEGALEPTAVVTRGYAMKLEFGPVTNGKTAGKIYICLPDNSKSWLAGTFDVEILKGN